MSRRTDFLSALGAALGLILALSCTHPAFADDDVFRYAAKFVCSSDGSIDFDGGGASSTLGSTEGVLVPADLFQTAVNVLNPGPEPVTIDAEVVLAHEPFESPRRGVVGTGLVLEARDALEFDCGAFAAAARAAVPGGTGFLVLDADRALEVAAVYSVLEKSSCAHGPRDFVEGRGTGGGDCKGAGVSLDVEYIEPTIIAGQRRPDLIVLLTGETPTEQCGINQCALRVPLEIQNIGDADVTVPFELHVTVTNIAASNSPYRHRYVAGVAAGERVPLVVGPIVTDGSCFDPDCRVDVIVDATDVVDESEEGNNTHGGSFFP